MDHDAQVVGSDTQILAGLDALRFLCSNFEIGRNQACMAKSNIFSKLYAQTLTRETTMASSFSSPPPSSMLHSPRQHRKAYKPSHVPPLKEAPASPHRKSPLTDDPLALKTISNCPTIHDDSSLSNMKKSSISGKSSVVMSDCHANDSSITKMSKGKRNKRHNSQCGTTVMCKNLACKAVLHAGAAFCRRCSCCICKEFDDNKDPSLWITCDAEEQDGCGLSCHIECALQERVAGVVRRNGPVSLDGSFFCRSCGKVRSLMSLWKKQLLIAKNARRVDVFCHRLLLSHKLLKGTLKYKDVHSLIDIAVGKLEVEVGLMTRCFAKLERSIVNRLSCNEEVQNMIDLALEKAESLCEAHSVIVDAKNAASEKAACTIQFEEACSSSIVVVAVDNHPSDSSLGYKLWHRKATDPSYPASPTYTIQSTSKKILVSNLQPQTLYAFKMAPFSAECDGEDCEAECCTEGMESTVVENQTDDGISDSIHEANTGETRNVQKPQQQSSIVFQCIQTTEKHGGPKEDLSKMNLPSLPEAIEGKDNNSVEELGNVIATANEEQKSPQGCACESTELPKVIDIHEEQKSPRGDVCEGTELPKVTDTHEEPKCQNEKVFVLKETSKYDPTRVASVDIMDSSNAAFQTGAMELCNVAQGRNLAVAGNGKDDSLCDHSKVDLHNFEFAIRVIRWLECEGHLDKEFRKKFLTWYSLRATEHEKRVVSVFIDTLQDSASSLAAQLVDTFQDVIDSKRQRVTEIGYYRRRYK